MRHVGSRQNQNFKFCEELVAKTAQYASQCPDFQAIPSGLGQQVSQRLLGNVRTLRRKEIAAPLQQAEKLPDHPVQLCLRGRRVQFDFWRARQRLVLRPFIGAKDYGLRKVERAEFRVDRHGNDTARNGYFFGFEP